MNPAQEPDIAALMKLADEYADVSAEVSGAFERANFKVDIAALHDERHAARVALQSALLALQGERDELRTKVAKAESLNVYFRDGVGECHVMISRDMAEYQIRTNWESTDLPPRVSKLIARAHVAERERDADKVLANKYRVAAAAMQVERDAAIKDAERYRWLRIRVLSWHVDPRDADANGDDVDAEIDARRQTEGRG